MYCVLLITRDTEYELSDSFFGLGLLVAHERVRYEGDVLDKWYSEEESEEHHNEVYFVHGRD